MKRITTILAASAFALLAASVSAEEEKLLNIYNWSDYIAEDTLANFEKETGIKVVYDVFDSNDVLEAKLMSGRTGYDIVVPSSTFMARQIQAGVFQPLDTSKIPNLKNLDPVMMKRLDTMDPGNKYGVPYLWGTTGIGYNVKKIKELLGDDAPVNSWDLFYDPKYASKLASCGIAVLDAWDEIIPATLNYLGEDPNSHDAKLVKGKVKDKLMEIRPYITYFHSSQYINDLANGDVCLAVGWSGDIIQAMDRAEDAGAGVELAYAIPHEGAGLWFDMLTVPKDAKHPENAFAFINYLLRPEVMAGITNYVWYPNAVPSSNPLIDEEITGDPSIYPDEETSSKLYSFEITPDKFDRMATRVWARVLSGR
ncbi:putrescine transport system substrate-binding protein [Sinobacterium caligoides]|uniref:Putrescine-binding periplasmic protein n=2 Tax=Sinobacterium caligoides TaxID=933926 RepID=A0A3N2DJW4_9GAMM|nr:putrescine transport system substrate-binding protein [Sinobacterium caligoides]